MAHELAPTGPPPEPWRTPQGPSIDLLGLALVGLKESTIRGYLKDLRLFADWAGGGSTESKLWALARLERGPANALVTAYVAHMQDAKLSPATIRRRVAALCRVVAAARRVGITGIALEVELPRAECLRDTAGPGAKGWGAMLELVERRAGMGRRRAERDRAIVLLMHDRALRRGEVAGLDYPGDVDLSRPAVQILGKGKSAKEWLTVNDRTRAALESWLERRGDWPGPLFCRGDNAAKDAGMRQRLSGDAINRLVRALGYAAGLARRQRAHGLRHQAITEALDRGFDVRDVRLFSRHAKIDTVLIYDDRRRDLGGEISRSLGAGSGRRKRGG